MSHRPTDTSEKGLEALIVAALTGRTSRVARLREEFRKPRVTYGGAGYIEGDPNGTAKGDTLNY